MFRHEAVVTGLTPGRRVEGRPQDLPLVASNNLTSFTIFESTTGLVSSYVFDTRTPAGPVTKFDEFSSA